MSRPLPLFYMLPKIESQKFAGPPLYARFTFLVLRAGKHRATADRPIENVVESLGKCRFAAGGQ